MASRVGGGGYAENRGGLGDRTGGGNSANGRDGRTGGGERKGGGISEAEKAARAQYSQSMRAAGMANLAGPHGFNSAVGGYNDRSWGWDVLDFIAGPFIDVNRPDPTIPGSYRGGDWHTSTNVPGVIGSLGGGLLAGPLGAQIGGFLGSQIPGGDIYHGGWGGASGPARPGPLGSGNGGFGDRGGSGPFGQPAAPQLGQATPATPLGAPPTAPGPAQTYQVPSWLKVPGPSPYAVQQPGYNYWRGM